MIFLLFPAISLALPDQIQPIPAPTSLAFEQMITKEVFAYGEIIPITTDIRNDGIVPVNLSGVPPEIVVSVRKTGWNRGVIRTIPGGMETLTLGPHSNQRWIVSWDQKDDWRMQVQPGVYYLTMNASGMNAYAEIIIQYPDGALTGTISPMQNVTSQGITTRLESVALHENEGLITVQVIPPSTFITLGSSPGFSQITAEYRVDNGPPLNFRDVTGKFPENGAYEITWQTAPIPCSANVMNIRATKFDPYRGDWNFSVNLDSLSQCTSGNGTVFPREKVVRNPGFLPISPTPKSASLPVIIAVGILAFTAVLAAVVRKKL
jgi:hypothetical protein